MIPEAVVEIAKILIKADCDNWQWNIINKNLRLKYLNKAEQILKALEDLGWKRPM